MNLFHLCFHKIVLLSRQYNNLVPPLTGELRDPKLVSNYLSAKRKQRLLSMNQDDASDNNLGSSKYVNSFIDLVEDEGGNSNNDDVQIIAVVEGSSNDQSPAVQFIQERRLPNLIQRRAVNTQSATSIGRSTRSNRSTRNNRRTRRRRRTNGNRRQRNTAGLFRLINSMVQQPYVNESDNEGSANHGRRRNYIPNDDGNYFPDDILEDELDGNDGAYGEDYEELLALVDRLGDVKPKGLSKRALDALPHRSFNINPRLETPICTICLSTFEQGDNLIHLKCDHYFHKQCARRWLEKNATCPVCRVKVATTINLAKQ